MTVWNIVRTKPIKKTYGQAFPIFIHNDSYHLSTIEVFSDGAIGCWGLNDRDFFLRRVQSGWVALHPPVGSRLSVFNLGFGTVAEATWTRSPDEILRQVEDVLRQLNPTLEGLVDFEGSDTEERGKIKYAKLGLADEKPYRMSDNGEEILGDTLPVFLVDGADYHLTKWFVYADGMSSIGPDGPIVALEEIISLIERGIVRTQIPEEATITFSGLGKARITQGLWYIDEQERIKEALDMIAMLNGKEGTISICRQQFKEYQQEPSETNKERLRQAYEAVPEHLRIFCGDMDSKDWPIKHVLYGDGQDEEDTEN